MRRAEDLSIYTELYSKEILSAEIAALKDFQAKFSYLRKKILESLRSDYRHSFLVIRELLNELIEELETEIQNDLSGNSSNTHSFEVSYNLNSIQCDCITLLDVIRIINDIVVNSKFFHEKDNPDSKNFFDDKFAALERVDQEIADTIREKLYKEKSPLKGFARILYQEAPSSSETNEQPELSPIEKQFLQFQIDLWKLLLLEEEDGLRLNNLAEFQEAINNANKKLTEKGFNLQPQADILMFFCNNRKYGISINSKGKFELNRSKNS